MPRRIIELRSIDATQFIKASESGGLSTVQHFLTKNIVAGTVIDKDLQNTLQKALSMALNNRHIEIARLLMKSGAKISDESLILLEKLERENAFFDAASKGDLVTIEKFIAEGAGVSAIGEGFKALIFAACEGYYDVAEVLLKNGAKINLTNDKMGLALINTLRFDAGGQSEKLMEQRLKIAELLIAKGTDINGQDKFGATALMLAIQRAQDTSSTKTIKEQSLGIANLLIDSGANIYLERHVRKYSIINNGGDFTVSKYTAIDYAEEGPIKDRLVQISTQTDIMIQALEERDIEKAMHAIKSGAYISRLFTFQGHEVTPLILASIMGLVKVVELLIAKNVDVNMEAKKKLTALMAASKFGQDTVLKLLLDAGADVNTCSLIGETALMLAAKKKNNIKTVELLLAHGIGIDIYLQDKNGKTAVDYAAEGPIKRLLIQTDKLFVKGDIDLCAIPLKLISKFGSTIPKDETDYVNMPGLEPAYDDDMPRKLAAKDAKPANDVINKESMALDNAPLNDETKSPKHFTNVFPLLERVQDDSPSKMPKADTGSKGEAPKEQPDNQQFEGAEEAKAPEEQPVLKFNPDDFKQIKDGQRHDKFLDNEYSTPKNKLTPNLEWVNECIKDFSQELKQNGKVDNQQFEGAEEAKAPEQPVFEFINPEDLNQIKDDQRHDKLLDNEYSSLSFGGEVEHSIVYLAALTLLMFTNS